MDDYISRQAAIDAADTIIARDTSGNNDVVKAMIAWKEYVKGLPSAPPEQTDCEYCHEDSGGYVIPLEKNGHAVVRCSPINGWILSVKYGAWRKDVPIQYCPICGRELKSNGRKHDS